MSVTSRSTIPYYWKVRHFRIILAIFIIPFIGQLWYSTALRPGKGTTEYPCVLKRLAPRRGPSRAKVGALAKLVRLGSARG
eukprot:scaffold870_cov268-Pinguiococcus_pyrenoidosus.AAC.14